MVRPATSEASTSANEPSYTRACAMLVSDPEVMGGVPVVCGTRIPVRLVAEMRRQGASVEEILAGYPSLTAEQIALAKLYAEGEAGSEPDFKTRLPRGSRVIARKTVPLERAS